MKYAHVINNTINELVESDPFTLFVPGYAAQFIEVADEVQAGWKLIDGGWQVPTVDIDALKSASWEAIKTERDRRTQNGGYLAAGKWFHSDTFSRTQQMALVMMGASIPAGLQWKTMDGSFVTMTQTLASQVFAAAAASDAVIFARAEQIKAAMEADPAAFDLAAHAWPIVFSS